MNYKELQNQLKTFKTQGLTTIALNAKKNILEAEYNRVMNAMIKDALATEPEIIEDTEIVATANETINEAVNFATEIITPEIIPTNEAIIEDTEAMNEAVTIATEIIEDLTDNNEAQISQVSIAESTLSINSESMATINEAVTSKEFIEALSKLLIIFVSSIVKLWCQVNRISLLTKVLARSRSGAARSINEARADIKTFMQWYFSGFTLPSFS